MKIFTIALALILLGGGCTSASDVLLSSSTDEMIYLPSPKALSEVVAQLEPDLLIHGINLIDDEGRSNLLQLAPPTNDADEILSQYAEAYEPTASLLIRILSTPDKSLNTELKRARNIEAEAIKETLDTVEILIPETTMVSEVFVAGPREEIVAFRIRMGYPR